MAHKLHRKDDLLSARDAVVGPDNSGRERMTEHRAMEVEGLFLWCRDVMTLTITRALYGDPNAFIQDKSLIEKSW